jgi:DNA-binding NarL/FixJ family response regulator
MPPPIRVALVEDDHGTREGLVELLRHAPNLTCIGAYETTAEAEHEIPRLSPDVVLMDINLGGDSGIGCVERLKRANPQLQFLMLTTYDDSELIFKSLRAGASGYLLKRAAGMELLAAIEEGHRGGSPMSMQIARKVISHFQHRPPGGEDEQLTEREAEILRMLIKGLTSPRIATQLGISHGVVRAHLHAIYNKLHLRARSEAGARFLGELPGAGAAQGAETTETCTTPGIGPNGLYRGAKR